MIYGLVGNPLAHSYSKEIHEALKKYEYDLFSLTQEEMREFINSRRFSGLNVTIPYKKDVIPLCDEISDLAQSIGAVNTLYWKNGSHNVNSQDIKSQDVNSAGAASSSSLETSCSCEKILVGHNTDYEGFLYAASRAGISFEKKTVLILGTGGTSLMARLAVKNKNAGKIYIASRKKTNSPEDNSRRFSKKAGASHVSAGDDSAAFTTIGYDEIDSIAAKIDVLINTTPVGTYPNNLQSVISLDAFKNCESVMDVIYNPFKTKLLLEAEKLGLKTSNGLPMLVAQATAAAGYFLGTPGAFEKDNERIISQMERQMRNIVLIGMPGCGKSTIGKIISEITEKPFADIDDEIVKEAGISIPEIFEKEGEPGFRDRETEITEKLGKQRGRVIAAGGGTVLRRKNLDALRQNALIIHIKRDLETLATKGRPLSKDMNTLREMEKIRLPIYRSAADITFDNSKSRSKGKLTEALKELLGYN